MTISHWILTGAALCSLVVAFWILQGVRDVERLKREMADRAKKQSRNKEEEC
jgi:hypothetical protein